MTQTERYQLAFLLWAIVAIAAASLPSDGARLAGWVFPTFALLGAVVWIAQSDSDGAL